MRSPMDQSGEGLKRPFFLPPGIIFSAGDPVSLSWPDSEVDIVVECGTLSGTLFGSERLVENGDIVGEHSECFSVIRKQTA